MHRITRESRIYSKAHFLISLAVGAVLSQLLAVPAAVPDVAVIAYAGLLGVAIDLDHFLIARYTTGDWEAVWRCLRSPRLVLLDQESIFPETSIWPLQRLFTHVLLAGPVTVAVAAVSVPLGLVTGAVLYVHVLSDLVADVRQLDAYHHQHASYVADRQGEPDRSAD